jgi:hypothetical protein
MRQARSFIGGAFLPASADEMVALVTSGKQEGVYILQVFGYWDMVAAFALHGALDPALLYDVCQEMYFQYAKIQPYLAAFREKMPFPSGCGTSSAWSKDRLRGAPGLRSCAGMWNRSPGSGRSLCRASWSALKTKPSGPLVDSDPTLG